MAFKSAEYRREGWRLFSTYLEYVLRTSDHPEYSNECSAHFANAVEASANSLSAWAAGVSVAVEGILNQVSLSKSKEELDQISRLQADVKALIKADQRFASLSRRLEGLLGMLSQVRVQDRLKLLLDRGETTKVLVDSWHELRNKVVHPKRIDASRLNDRKFQEMLDVLHRVVTLQYHILFHIIGYCGPYSNYSERDFPMHVYPPGQDPAKSG
jgi:hypothetical protein